MRKIHSLYLLHSELGAVLLSKGGTDRVMATGGSKSSMELVKEQKTRQTQMICDGLDAAMASQGLLRCIWLRRVVL